MSPAFASSAFRKSPNGVRPNSPPHTTIVLSSIAVAIGLVMEGAAQRRRGQVARETRNVRQVLANMRSWFERNF